MGPNIDTHKLLIIYTKPYIHRRHDPSGDKNLKTLSDGIDTFNKDLAHVKPGRHIRLTPEAIT